MPVKQVTFDNALIAFRSRTIYIICIQDENTEYSYIVSKF